MMTSLDLPERSDLRVVLYPSWYLPDLIREEGEVGRAVSTASGASRGGNRAGGFGEAAMRSRQSHAPHDDLELGVESIALGRLLLGLDGFDGSAHGLTVEYSLLKRVKRRCVSYEGGAAA